jgi:hypothetical protein
MRGRGRRRRRRRRMTTMMTMITMRMTRGSCEDDEGEGREMKGTRQMAQMVL